MSIIYNEIRYNSRVDLQREKLLREKLLREKLLQQKKCVAAKNLLPAGAHFIKNFLMNSATMHEIIIVL